jgi:hypothetical protein
MKNVRCVRGPYDRGRAELCLAGTLGLLIGALAGSPSTLAAAGDALTFGELPAGTTVTDQYEQQGVRFTSKVSTTGDDAGPTSPVRGHAALERAPARRPHPPPLDDVPGLDAPA